MEEARCVVSPTLGDRPGDHASPSVEIFSLGNGVCSLKNPNLSSAEFCGHAEQLRERWPFGLALYENQGRGFGAWVCVLFKFENGALCFNANKDRLGFLSAFVKKEDRASARGQVDPKKVVGVLCAKLGSASGVAQNGLCQIASHSGRTR
jgi:hypothetical protein